MPNPVTGSHPTVAGNPDVLQPAELPLTTSVNALYPPLYSHGFKNPSGGRPAASSASFASPRMPAQIGDDPEVPTRFALDPFQIVGKGPPLQEISG